MIPSSAGTDGAADRLAGLTHRDADWSGLRVVVAGLGVSGFAAADALLERGGLVTVVDALEPAEGSALSERARILGVLGAALRFGPEATSDLPAGPLDLVVTSPGWRPDQPLLAEAAAARHPGVGRGRARLADAGRGRGAAPWLTVTGTNGKTTTVRMLAGDPPGGRAARDVRRQRRHPHPRGGRSTRSPTTCIAVELSSFQLHWSVLDRPARLRAASTSRRTTSTGTAPSRSTCGPRAGSTTAPRSPASTTSQDPRTERLVEDAEVEEGCRAIGFTLGVPAPSMVGLVDDVLADRAFVEQRRTMPPPSSATLADLAG